MKHFVVAAAASLSLAAATAYAEPRTHSVSAKRVAHAASETSTGGLNATEVAIILTGIAVLGAVLSSSTPAASTTTFTAVSDARLKTDVTRVGTSPSGLPVYTYRYGTAPELYRGVMAQDLVDLAPHAVVPLKGGYLGVDYGQIDVTFEQVK